MRSLKFRFTKIALIAALSALFLQLSSSDSYGQRRRKKVSGCVTHVLNYGESIPSLLNRYEVRLSDLIEFNPGIEGEVAIGQLIYVPRKKMGKATQAEIQQDIDKIEKRNSPNDSDIETQKKEEVKVETNQPTEPVSTTTTIIHNVKAGETFYSISRMYGVTVAQIEEANPSISRDDMSIGTELKIVIEKKVETSDIEDETTDILNTETPTTSTTTIIDREKYNFSTNNGAIKVSLILPLKSERGQSAQFTDFYQGFLAGLDSLKNEGVTVQLNTFNVGRGDEKLTSLVDSEVLLGSNIVVGPVYAEQFNIVAEQLSTKGIPVISPLGHIDSHSPNAFQVAPSSLTKYDKLKENIADKNVILLSTLHDDKEFVDKMNEFTGGNIKTIPFNIKKTAQAYAEDLPTDKGVVYLVAATDPLEMDAIISKIGAIRIFGLGRDISSIATSKVARAKNIDPALLFDANLSYTTSYHADRTNPLVREFDKRYMKLFGKLPSLYSYRGYDVALFFLGSLKEFESDFNEYIVDYYTTILQVTYKFSAENPGEKLVNSEWMMVTHNPQYDVVVK